jgi:hypothetical protein
MSLKKGKGALLFCKKIIFAVSFFQYDTAEAGKNRLLLFKTFYLKLCVLHGTSQVLGNR